MDQRRIQGGVRPTPTSKRETERKEEKRKK
jgi:hypothetical protein